VRAVDDVECWTLTKNQFSQIFDENLKKVLLERIDLQDTQINYEDLCPVEVLYKGVLSTFVLCANRSNSKTYVLKSIHRNKIMAQNLQLNIVAQKKILSQVDHFLIAKLVKTFKNPFRISFLMEHVDGKDFSFVLKSLGKIDELDARFYAGCLVMIFEYLHDHDILYRDLNLKNLLVDVQGYLKLIDFTCAKYVVGRTFTIIGTPHFLAPEVINGQGYSKPADLWSLGVLLFFVLYGKLPFGDNLNDPIEIYQNILNTRVNFPQNVNPLSKSRDFLSSILNKNQSQRGKISDLRIHPWFVGLNWEFLMARQIKAPFLPVSKEFKDIVHDSIKIQRKIEEVLPNFENSERYRPKFNSNLKWDAEF
jgi:cGMP-dependent protein kinase